ncbi:hypothetical protein Tco_0371807 [Tanacetum coccineum]
MLKEFKKQIAKEQTIKENMSIEEMMHEQQLVDHKIKEITNDLGIRRFRGEEIDEEYKIICEITIRKLKQDFNIWGSKVGKKEKAYEDEKYVATCHYMLSVTCDNEDDYIPLAITIDLPIEEPDNSLNMGDEHLDTILATESEEVIKSSVENLVPIPSEFEGISDNMSDVPNCDNNYVNIKSELVESLVNRDTSIVHSSKINPIFEEFAGELAHIVPIPPLEEVNDVNQEEKEFVLDDILQIQDVSLRKIVEPIILRDLEVGRPQLQSNYSLPEYESFHFDNPSLPRPPPEPPDIEILKPEINNFDESFEPGEGENIVVSNVEEDDSFTFTIRTFLPFLTYPKVSPLSCSIGSEDTIFDPGIFT